MAVYTLYIVKLKAKHKPGFSLSENFMYCVIKALCTQCVPIFIKLCINFFLAAMFVKQKLPDLLRSYIDSGNTTVCMYHSPLQFI